MKDQQTTEAGQYTQGPWVWGSDVDDLPREWYEQDDEGNAPSKYMDLSLRGTGRQIIIPTRIDHYNMNWDGPWISKADRDLIEAAPELLAALQACVTAAGSHHLGEDNHYHAVQAAARKARAAIALATE